MFLALAVAGLTAAPPATEETAVSDAASNEFHLDTPAYRSAKALAAGRGEAPAPAEAAERHVFLTERGLWLLRLEQWKLAEADFLALLQKAPKDVTARSGLALAAQRSGHSEAAQKW